MIRRLMHSIREYRVQTIKTPVLVVLEVIMEVLIPLLMAQLIDRGIDAGEMTVVYKYGGALLAFALVSLTFGALAGKYAAEASAGFAANLRRDIFKNVQSFSFANIDKFSSSSIITRLTTDITNVQNAFQMVIRMAVRSPFMLVFALVAAFSIDHKLSMIFLALLPIMGVGLFLVIKFAFPVFMRVFKKYDKMNQRVQENLHGIRVVKSFVREKYESERFEEISKDIHDDFVKAERTVAFNMPLIQFCVFASMLLLSWFGARAIVASGNNAALGLSTGELMSLITYTMQILMSLMMLSMVMVMLTISKASAERIVEVLDEESDLKNGDDPIMEVPDGSIEFKNVCFSYSKDAAKLCLDNINLKINSGETIGIIGVTGSAKSTLIQLIPRLYDATCGSVMVGGIDVKEYDLQSLRDQVAVVLQKNILFSGTIRDNLRWGDRDATDEQLEHVCKLAQADKFINAYPEGYDTWIEQGGSNVSGGQKQRLCIARALLKHPKILILDDSTSAVDTATDSRIREALRSEMPNTTKLIIAQRIASVQDADRIIIMDDGHISNFGTHEELLKSSSIYREVFESQQKGGLGA
ncbi:MAG: ABC transporter ATP-binding protein [Clostridiaceae bacterium]|nr:ABC transporter ATP-binding protein [Clostridiaceae bacterium]